MLVWDSLTQKQEEKEEVQQERYIDKKEQVVQEWVETDHQSERKVEWYLVQETPRTTLFLWIEKRDKKHSLVFSLQK